MESGFGDLLSVSVSDSKKWYALYDIMPSQHLNFPSLSKIKKIESLMVVG